MSISDEAMDAITELVSQVAEMLDGKCDEMLSDFISATDGDESEESAIKYANMVYYRGKYYSEGDNIKSLKPVNKVTHYGDMFTIDNYSYSMYKWACSNGFSEYAIPLRIFMPENMLTDSQKKQLFSKV